MIGDGVGKNSTLINSADIDFMGDVLVQADRGNNVMGHSEAMYAIQEINPTLEQKQAKYKFDRNVLTKSYDNGKIKKRNFKEQAITTERTSIMYQP